MASGGKRSRLRLARHPFPGAFLRAIIALAVAAGFWACEKQDAVLTVLIWSDYINPALVAEFQKLTGCTVRLETYSDNEELKAMLREGRFAADVIVPSSYEIQTLRDEGFLMRLNDRKLENRRHIDEKFIKSFGLDKYASVAVPYFVAPTGLAYRPKDLQRNVGTRVDSTEPATISWSILEAPLMNGSGKKAASFATLLNDKREAIGVALLASGSEDVNALDLPNGFGEPRRPCSAGLLPDCASTESLINITCSRVEKSSVTPGSGMSCRWRRRCASRCPRRDLSSRAIALRSSALVVTSILPINLSIICARRKCALETWNGAFIAPRMKRPTSWLRESSPPLRRNSLPPPGWRRDKCSGRSLHKPSGSTTSFGTSSSRIEKNKCKPDRGGFLLEAFS